MVTPPFDSPAAALKFMEALHDLISLELKMKFVAAAIAATFAR